MAHGFVDASLNKFGPFGRYNGLWKVNNATVAFTGSNIGASALLIGEACTGTATLARGGDTIDLSQLTAGVVYELGLSSITVSNAKDVYVLKR
jgi:hypothetical protein